VEPPVEQAAPHEAGTPEPHAEQAAPDASPRAGEYLTTSLDAAESASAEPTVTGSHEEALAPEMPEHEAASLPPEPAADAASLPPEPAADAASTSPEPTASGLYGDAVPAAPGGSAGTIEDAQPTPGEAGAAETVATDPALAPLAEIQPGTMAAAPKPKGQAVKPKGGGAGGKGGGGGGGGGGGKSRSNQKPGSPRGPGGQT
jgi:hypothetical protein